MYAAVGCEIRCRTTDLPTRWRDVSSRLALLLLASCLWLPMVSWMGKRWFSSSGWLFGPALLAATVAGWVYLLVRCNDDTDTSSVCTPAWALAATVCVTLYALLYSHVPRLVSWELMASSAACVMLGTLSRETRRRSWGIVPLVMFSIHLTPSLQFFLGFPLRVVTGKLTALMMGQTVQPVGSGLSDGVHTVFIDAPCSGIRMLTTLIVLAAGAAFVLQLPRLRTLGLIAAGLLMTLFGNALRAASLFILETRTPFADRGHTAIGVVVFSGCALLLVWAALLLKRSQGPGRKQRILPNAGATRYPVFTQLLVLVSLTVLLIQMTSPRQAVANETPKGEAVWPESWGGEPLIRIPLDGGTEKLLSAFPGTIAQFRVGDTGRLVLLRRCTMPTRRLHPAEDCYKGTGWKCHPLPALKDRHGHVWGRFRAVRADGTERAIRQCYFAVPPDESEKTLEDLLAGTSSWPDASSWYWAAARPRSPIAVTLAVTVSE